MPGFRAIGGVASQQAGRPVTGRRLVSLGSVRTPKPVNLPSQRLENRGLDVNVEIVPRGGAGWRAGSPPQQPSTAWGSAAAAQRGATQGAAGSPAGGYGQPARASPGDAPGGSFGTPPPSSGGGWSNVVQGGAATVKMAPAAGGGVARPASATATMEGARAPGGPPGGRGGPEGGPPASAWGAPHAYPPARGQGPQGAAPGDRPYTPQHGGGAGMHDRGGAGYSAAQLRDFPSLSAATAKDDGSAGVGLAPAPAPGGDMPRMPPGGEPLDAHGHEHGHAHGHTHEHGHGHGHDREYGRRDHRGAPYGAYGPGGTDSPRDDVGGRDREQGRGAPSGGYSDAGMGHPPGPLAESWRRDGGGSAPGPQGYGEGPPQWRRKDAPGGGGAPYYHGGAGGGGGMYHDPYAGGPPQRYHPGPFGPGPVDYYRGGPMGGGPDGRGGAMPYPAGGFEGHGYPHPMGGFRGQPMRGQGPGYPGPPPHGWRDEGGMYGGMAGPGRPPGPGPHGMSFPVKDEYARGGRPHGYGGGGRAEREGEHPGMDRGGGRGQGQGRPLDGPPNEGKDGLGMRRPGADMAQGPARDGQGVTAGGRGGEGRTGADEGGAGAAPPHGTVSSTSGAPQVAHVAHHAPHHHHHGGHHGGHAHPHLDWAADDYEAMDYSKPVFDDEVLPSDLSSAMGATAVDVRAQQQQQQQQQAQAHGQQYLPAPHAPMRHGGHAEPHFEQGRPVRGNEGHMAGHHHGGGMPLFAPHGMHGEPHHVPQGGHVHGHVQGHPLQGPHDMRAQQGPPVRILMRPHGSEGGGTTWGGTRPLGGLRSRVPRSHTLSTCRQRTLRTRSRRRRSNSHNRHRMSPRQPR
eukprot:jgi/Mesvir1/16405/Mv18141-RA.1